MVIINNQDPLIDSYYFRDIHNACFLISRKGLVRESVPRVTAVRFKSLSKGSWLAKATLQRVTEAETDFSHAITQYN